MQFEPYAERLKHLPDAGQHIVAHYDDLGIIVYQAYAPEIGAFAVQYGSFDGAPGFLLNRMTWIKPNFLWMMHRSNWGRKPNQEMILAITLDRVGFDAILRKAVHTSFQPDIYQSQESWQTAMGGSAVRLQWDPDYDPGDNRLKRRAIQIGLGGKAGRHYAQGGWILDIEDITDFVHAQREHAESPYDQLIVPRERVLSGV